MCIRDSPKTAAPEWKTVIAMREVVTWKLRPKVPTKPMSVMGRSRSGVDLMWRKASRSRVPPCRGGPGLLSSAGRMLISPYRTARYEAALRRNTGPVPAAATVRPAMAGPRVRAMLNWAEFRLTAAGTRSRATSSEMKALRAGVSMAVAVPRANARAYTEGRFTASVTVRTPSSSDCTAMAVCVISSSRRLGKRSARTPPVRPNRVWGRNWRAVTRPTALPLLPVRWRTSRSWAARCIQVPMLEVSCPIR